MCFPVIERRLLLLFPFKLKKAAPHGTALFFELTESTGK